MTTTNIFAQEGCKYRGEVHLVGAMIAINEDDLSARKKAGEDIYDGDAILMKCSFIVKLNKNLSIAQYPKIKKRQYTWVAFDWAWN